ncbi:hypothetical protein EYC84_007687 [Monilinia fructicola]|nr:hypothetical protein EYC84_007687 [Monilinia fructicola]
MPVEENSRIGVSSDSLLCHFAMFTVFDGKNGVWTGYGDWAGAKSAKLMVDDIILHLRRSGSTGDIYPIWHDGLVGMVFSRHAMDGNGLFTRYGSLERAL